MATKLKINMDQLLGVPFLDYEKIHSFSKQRDTVNKKKINTSNTRNGKSIKLMSTDTIKLSLRKVIENRESKRDFSKKPISLSIISSLLSHSFGKLGKYNYPSLGNIYSQEIYLVILRSDIEKGIYHYDSKNFSLTMIKKLSLFDFKKYFTQTWMKNASAIVIIASDFEKTLNKFSNKGYRSILIETGELAQNFYLTSSALNLNTCEIGGYFDEKFEKLIGIDGKREMITGVLCVGYGNEREVVVSKMNKKRF